MSMWFKSVNVDSPDSESNKQNNFDICKKTCTKYLTGKGRLGINVPLAHRGIAVGAAGREKDLSEENKY